MTLAENSTSSRTGPVSVWTIHLGLGTLPVLLRTFLRHGRFQLTYTAASKDGKALAGLLRVAGILSSAAKHVKFSLHGLRVDDRESPRLLVQGWLPNQFTELFMRVNEALLAKFTYPDPRVRRDRVIINLRKAAAQTTVDVLALLELARYYHKIEDASYRRLVIITPHAALAHLIPKEWVGEDVEFKTPWKRDYSLGLRLGRSVLRFLGDSMRPQKKKVDQPPTIAADTVWGINPTERLNDLFWYWDSKISSERIILFFDRPDSMVARATLAEAQQAGIRCVLLEKKSVGDSPHLLWQASPGFGTAATRLWRSVRMFSWAVLRGRSRRWIARQTMDMMHSSERMEDFLSDFNVKGLFHHQDGGLDYLSLACDAVGAARIGHHWSYFPWPETAVARLHQVYFVWGDYQSEMLDATGSEVDHVLQSGCTVHGAYPGSDLEDAPDVDRSAVEAAGASRVIALFDTSLPCAGFYDYFLRKVVQDSRLGLLIKPKNPNPPWRRYQMPELLSLYEEAMATGRVKMIDPMVSPTQAAAAADISVAVDINSAAICSALAGHRAVHLDYARVHDSPLSDWATLHKAGPNRLVFDDPDKLWEQIELFYDQRDGSVAGADSELGVANDDVLAHIDPFRDGRAGERIGQYLGWYLEALDEGQERDPALRQADAKYAAAWGDWTVDSGLPGPLPSPIKANGVGTAGTRYSEERDPATGAPH